MKKIYSLLFVLFFCLIFPGCSFVLTKSKPVVVNNPAQIAEETMENVPENNEKTASSAPIVLPQTDNIDEIISFLNGDNFRKMVSRSKSNNDNNSKQLTDYFRSVSDYQKMYQEVCSYAEASYAKEIDVNNFNSDEVTYFWPEDENSFDKNLIVSLAIKESINCSAVLIRKSYEYLTPTSTALIFFYESLLKTITADILLDLVILDNVAKHPEYCQNIADTYKMGKLCRTLRVDDVDKSLKQYYEISGFWDYFREKFPAIVFDKGQGSVKDSYIASKIGVIQLNIEANRKASKDSSNLAVSSSNPLWDMTSLIGWIETLDEIIDTGSE